MNKPKCEEVGFEHNWKDITPSIVYLTYPPQYPDPVRECINCGKKQTQVVKQREIKEWLDS